MPGHDKTTHEAGAEELERAAADHRFPYKRRAAVEREPGLQRVEGEGRAVGRSVCGVGIDVGGLLRGDIRNARRIAETNRESAQKHS